MYFILNEFKFNLYKINKITLALFDIILLFLNIHQINHYYVASFISILNDASII